SGASLWKGDLTLVEVNLRYDVGSVEDKSQLFFFFSSRRRHTRSKRDWSSDVCSSDLFTMKILVETSARHIHVTDETLEKLFGKGYQLTVKKMLSQPGQYASNERVTVVGPKRELANVSILGPTRKVNQVELSATDARSIGVAAPVRGSGDVAGSGACKLVGPAGEVELSEGVIIAKRHVHMTPEDA